MGSEWQNSHQLQQGSIRPFASSAALVFTQHHQAVLISPFLKRMKKNFVWLLMTLPTLHLT